MVRGRVKYAVLALAALICTAALAACGSGGGNKETNAAPLVAEQKLVVRASNWKYDQQEYTIPKDTPVEIELVDDQGAHGLKIEGTGVNLGGAQMSKVVKLAAGTYNIKCSLICGTGHLNMTATLIVQ